MWKRAGSAGYASTFLVKNSAFADVLAELKTTNVLRDIFKVAIADFKAQAEDEQSRSVLNDN
eukprot:10694833-Heterocapsa_arctica.AAC.1